MARYYYGPRAAELPDPGGQGTRRPGSPRPDRDQTNPRPGARRPESPRPGEQSGDQEPAGGGGRESRCTSAARHFGVVTSGSTPRIAINGSLASVAPAALILPPAGSVVIRPIAMLVLRQARGTV